MILVNFLRLSLGSDAKEYLLAAQPHPALQGRRAILHPPTPGQHRAHRFHFLGPYLRISKPNERRRNTYGIQQHHALVHDFQMVRHVSEIVSELRHQMVHLRCLDVDDERVREICVLGGDDQVVAHRQQNLNVVEAVAQVVVSVVKSLFFDDLVWIGGHHAGLVGGVPFLLVDAGVGAGALLLLDDEFRLHVLVDERVLADIFQDFDSLVVFALPLRHVVVGCLVLQSLEDKLVFFRDFHQFALAGVAV